MCGLLGACFNALDGWVVVGAYLGSFESLMGMVSLLRNLSHPNMYVSSGSAGRPRGSMGGSYGTGVVVAISGEGEGEGEESFRLLWWWWWWWSVLGGEAPRGARWVVSYHIH